MLTWFPRTGAIPVNLILIATSNSALPLGADHTVQYISQTRDQEILMLLLQVWNEVPSRSPSPFGENN